MTELYLLHTLRIKLYHKRTSIEYLYREDLGETYSAFGCENGYTCKAYFQSKDGVQARRKLAEEYKIAGISYWRLGGELDLLK
jgi:spore germination protein YaaH